MKAFLVLALFGLVGLAYAGIGPSDTRCGWTTALEVGGGALSMDWTGDVYVEPSSYSVTSARFMRKWQGAFTFQNAFVLGENWAYCQGQTQYDSYCGNFLTYIAPYWYQLGTGANPSVNYNCYYGYNYFNFGIEVETREYERTLSKLPNSSKYSVSVSDGAMHFRGTHGAIKLLKTDGELTALHATESSTGTPVIAFSIDNSPVNILHCIDTSCSSASLVKTTVEHDGEINVIPGENLTLETNGNAYVFPTSHGSPLDLQCTEKSAGTIFPIDNQIHACSANSEHPSFSRLYEWKSLAAPLHTVL